jgi:monothiol glutaredoxin
MSDAQTRIDQLVKSNEVVLFMKGNASFPQCGFSGRAIQILKACGVDTKGIQTVNVLEDEEVRQGIKEYSNWPTIPQLYVKGEFIGGSDIMMEMYESGELVQALGTTPPQLLNGCFPLKKRRHWTVLGAFLTLLPQLRRNFAIRRNLCHIHSKLLMN